LFVLISLAPLRAQITEYRVPFLGLSGIAAGPDGAMWVSGNGNIGRITTAGVVTVFPVPTPNDTSYAITAGPDGAMWFTESPLNSPASNGGWFAKIGRITTNGVITEYPLPNAMSIPAAIASGPDGALWFNELGGSNIGRITTSGVVTEFPLPAADVGVWGIASGPDGNLWLTQEYTADNILRMTTSGVVTTYTISSPDTAGSLDIVAGPDGAMWFCDGRHGKVGRITTSGTITEFPLPQANDSPWGIAAGPDGALWYTNSLGQIGRITTAGVVTSEVTTPSNTAGGYLTTIAAGPDGAMWFVELGGKVGRIAVPGSSGGGGTCTYTLGAGGAAFPSSGGSGAVNVTTTSGCAWNTSGAPSWVTFATGSGTGSGTASYTVAANSAADRSGTVTIAGQTFTIEEQGTVSGTLSYIGSMPHIAAQENWTTSFTLVNKGASSATARLSLFGDPSGPLTLPLLFPQIAGSPLPEVGSSLDRAISSNASLIVTSAGPQTPPVQIGSAQLSGTGAVDGFAIFHLIPGSQEAVVPMETRNASSYVLAYDNTGGVVLGVAVANVSAQAGTVGIVIRDDAGNQLTTGSLAMAAQGHTSFVLSTQYPITANKRGTIEFDTPPGGQISVLGIRTTPLGNSNTLTTIPALANVGTNGGSIAHIATGNGWQTTFVLVNTGTSSAQVNLNFFADLTGAPLSLPLSFPQTGTGSTASSVSQSLAAGASLLVQSAAPASNPAPTIGSAQLTTNGKVGGFVIFRYNPNGQEAVVPLESRTANGFLIAFDNTAGTATGIAINSVSSQAVNVPVIIRDDSGNQIGTDTLDLAANGHLAFTLVSDKYANTANIRGTIEFDTPAGGQIGALGIRIPVAHTFTTLPALAK
jgi:streptogramin lyase